MDRPRWLEPVYRCINPVFRHGMTNAGGPDLVSDPFSAEHAAAVGRIAAALGVGAAAWARQVHGGAVLQVAAPGCAGEADALWTDRAGLAVMGRSADCPIVLIAGCRADGSPLWGMAHASWRSTVADITGRLLDAMIASGLVPVSVAAAVAPSAGPCCYEVGDEVRAAAIAGLGNHAAEFFRKAGERWLLDLWAANLDTMISRGVPPEQIHFDRRCTICGAGFPSYRREGAGSGRFGVLVGI